MSGEASVPDPLVDDAYRDLFRDAGPPEPPSTPEPRAETGRLFRTFRAETATEAIVAVRPERARKLRTLAADDTAGQIVREASVATPEVSVGEESIDVTVTPERPRRRAPGLRPGAVYLVDIGLTVLVALIEVLLAGGIGWITGVALLVAAAYTGWVVRLSDWVVAVIALPIAFFVAAVTAGQIGLGVAGDSLLNRFAQVFFILGTSWIWILGAMALAFALTAIRRRTQP
jgi:hypothetical protein